MHSDITKERSVSASDSAYRSDMSDNQMVELSDSVIKKRGDQSTTTHTTVDGFKKIAISSRETKQVDDPECRVVPPVHSRFALAMSVCTPMFGLPAWWLTKKTEFYISKGELKRAWRCSDRALILCLAGLWFLGLIVIVCYILVMLMTYGVIEDFHVFGGTSLDGERLEWSDQHEGKSARKFLETGNRPMTKYQGSSLGDA